MKHWPTKVPVIGWSFKHPLLSTCLYAGTHSPVRSFCLRCSRPVCIWWRIFPFNGKILHHMQTGREHRKHMHRLHFFVTFEYGMARAIIFQVTANLSFRDQMCLLNSVAFLLFSFRNEAVWLLNLILNWFAISLIYVSFPLGLSTLAWYHVLG